MKGQIYFAWVNENETFDDTVHNRFDENVFAFKLSGSEGDFAALELTIKNPRIGLLNVARKVWCYLSIEKANGSIQALFKGRLIGVPTNIFDTLVQLDFTARPSNFASQKYALAQTMKVLPYYDPIFVNPDSWGDPDVVLEGYSVLWHIDPVTHVVTVSDIIVPEDGVEEVTDEEHFYDQMQVTLNQTPLRRVAVQATIPWTQSADGALDLTKAIKNLFGGDLATSFTMNGLIQDWPKQGDKFSNGWEVTSGSLTSVSYAMPKVVIPDIFSWQGVVPVLPEGSIVFPLKVTGEYHSGEKAGFNFQYELVIAAKDYAVPQLSVTYTAGRQLAQIVTFTLETDQQSIVTSPGDDEAMLIVINANKVSDPTESFDPSAPGAIPIGDVRGRGYVHSARGMQSVEHLLLVARAHLVARSRAVETVFQMPLLDGLRLCNMRKGALLHDHRLPGGEASGKIIGWELLLDGNQGEPVANIRIGSTVGYGGSHSTSAGDPVYAAAGYMAPGYQAYENVTVLTDTTDIAWTMPAFSFFDDGLPLDRGLTENNAIQLLEILNPASAQEAAINAAGDGANTDQAKISSVLQELPTQIRCQLKPMEGGPFTQEVVISVSDLIVPQQIDLEAPSNA